MLCMRALVFIFFCHLSLYAFSQEADTARQGKSKKLLLSKYPKPEPAPKKSAYVVVTSSKDSSAKKDSWENEWTDYIEEQSREIAGKVLTRDTARTVYKVMIGFFVNEDGSLKDLHVTCTPANNFIVTECVKMALNAPKKKSAGKSGKYIRMRVQQPVEIKVNAN